MTLELWNTIASTATFLVIAATAIAAIVQLSHARTSNQIAALNELRQHALSAEFETNLGYVSGNFQTDMQDLTFRNQLLNPKEQTPENRLKISRMHIVSNYFEGMGMMVKRGMIDRDTTLELFSNLVLATWRRTAYAISIERQRGGQGICENFEYLAVLSEDWIRLHPDGAYPRNVRRMKIPDTQK